MGGGVVCEGVEEIVAGAGGGGCAGELLALVGGCVETVESLAFGRDPEVGMVLVGKDGRGVEGSGVGGRFVRGERGDGGFGGEERGGEEEEEGEEFAHGGCSGDEGLL